MNFRKARREEPEINLIPLIDLFLVIIIFLMVSTTFNKFAELQITLPTADAQKASERPDEIHLAVGSDGRYTLDGSVLQARSPQALAEALRAARTRIAAGREPVIIIAADAQATHQSVIHVMEAARLAAIGQITFATQTSAASP